MKKNVKEEMITKLFHRQVYEIEVLLDRLPSNHVPLEEFEKHLIEGLEKDKNIIGFNISRKDSPHFILK